MGGVSYPVDYDLSFFGTERHKCAASFKSFLQRSILVNLALDFVDVYQIHAGRELQQTNLFECHGGLEVSDIDVLECFDNTEVLVVDFSAWSKLGDAVLVFLTFARIKGFLANIDLAEVCLVVRDNPFWLIVYVIIHLCMRSFKKIIAVNKVILLITNL